MKVNFIYLINNLNDRQTIFWKKIILTQQF